MNNLLKGTKHQLVKKSILNTQGRINPARSVGSDMLYKDIWKKKRR